MERQKGRYEGRRTKKVSADRGSREEEGREWLGGCGCVRIGRSSSNKDSRAS